MSRTIVIHILTKQKYVEALNKLNKDTLNCIKCGNEIHAGDLVVSRKIGSGGANHNIKDWYARSTHTIHYDYECAQELNII